MVYYYAHTGHKVGLDRARRGTAVVKALQKEGVDATLLANDFRAGVAMKELGLRDYITVETLLDVDAVAKEEDAVIVDTTEEDRGKLALYAERFACFARTASKEEAPLAGEVLLKEACAEEDGCLSSVIVDEAYFTDTPKVERILFFFGDADYDKTILAHEAFFKAVPMELLWGHYFFVKYEEAMAKLFTAIHESEEYVNAITTSSIVVTASSQTALEAKAAGAKTIYIAYETQPCYQVETLASYGVDIMEGFDANKLKHLLKEDDLKESKELSSFDVYHLINKCKSFA